MKKNMSLALVIFNEQYYLKKCIHSLFQQPKSMDRLEKMILLDNNSTDSTPQLLKELEHSHQMIEVHTMNVNNIGQSRTRAVELCTSELVAFIDADCEVSNEWLCALYKQFRAQQLLDPKVAGVCGNALLPDIDYLSRSLNLMMSLWWGHGGSAQAKKSTQIERVDHLPTTNCLLVKESLVQVGAFSSSYDRFGEDLELGVKLSQAGFTMYKVPEADIINNSASHLVQWCLRMFRFGRAQIKVTFDYGFFSVKRILPLALFPLIVGFVYQPILFICTFIAFYILSLLYLPISIKQGQLLNWPVIGGLLFCTYFSYSLGQVFELIKLVTYKIVAVYSLSKS